MPEKETIRRAQKKKHQGKEPTTQAGEFVREEMHHIRKGKHGARSPMQAIAIGLSKARKAGVKLKPPAKGQASERTQRRAERDYRKGQSGRAHTPSQRRSLATLGALEREGQGAASSRALAKQARQTARRRGPEKARTATIHVTASS